MACTTTFLPLTRNATEAKMAVFFPGFSAAGSWSLSCWTSRGRGPSTPAEGTVSTAAPAASRLLAGCLSPPASAGCVSTACAESAARCALTDPACARCAPKKRKSFLLPAAVRRHALTPRSAWQPLLGANNNSVSLTVGNWWSDSIPLDLASVTSNHEICPDDSAPGKTF